MRALFTPTALAYMVFCLCVHALARVLCKPIVVRIGINFPSHSNPELFNQIVSTYHSALFSIMYVYVWVFSGHQHQEFKDADPMHSLDHLLLELMIGYMLYDTSFEVLMMFRGRKTWSMHAQILLHHVMGLVTHGMIVDLDSGIAGRLMLVIYGAEVSTPFLNSSWILNHFDLSSNVFFKVVTGAVFVTFLYRLFIGPYVVYCLVSRVNHWSKFPLLFNILCVVASVFSLLNFFWFYKLYQRAVRHSQKLKKKPSLKSSTDESSSDDEFQNGTKKQK